MAQSFCKACLKMHFVEFTVTFLLPPHILLSKDPHNCRHGQEVFMFFRGLFLSFISFAAIVGVTNFITFAESRFFFLLRPFLPFLGILLLLFAPWCQYLAITILLCSAALTFFYAACRLKHFGGCCTGKRSCNTKRHPR